jgi:DNA-binding CsgD family transcriptional regulator/tetratricopeptide (TPR) repeat protein
MVTASADGRPGAWTTAAALPAGARAVLDQWLEGCSADCLTVLSAAAVVGRDFGLDLLIQTTGLVTDAVLDALDEAEAARIVTPVPGIAGGYAFVHALLREHLYGQLSTARRLRLHGQVCVALGQVYDADGSVRVADLAYHAFEAAPLGDVARAVRYARWAGDEAMAQLAYEEAVRQYGRALEALALAPSVDHRERGALLLALGQAQNATGEATAAEGTFVRAAAAGRACGSAEVLAGAALGFGGERIAEAGEDARRIALLEEALAVLGTGASDSTPALRVRVLIRLSEALRAPVDLERRRALSEEAVALARALDDPRLLGAALSARCGARWGPDEMAAVVADARELLALGEGAGAPALALQARHWLILDLLARGELRAADTAIDDLAERAAAARDPLARWQAASLRVLHPQLQGRFAEAEALAAEARALGDRVNRARAAETFEHQVWTGRVLREGWAGFIPRLEAAQEHFPLFPGWRAVLALAYADTGRADDARRELERLAIGDLSDLPRGPRWLHILAMLAHTSALLGDRRRALLLYALLEPVAGGAVFATDGLLWQGATDFYLGLLATTLGRWDAAARHFDAALALYAGDDVPVLTARAQQAYGTMLLTRGAPGDEGRARDLLAQASATERRLGLIAVVVPIPAMLPPASSPTPAALPDRITAREAEVLRLIAGGRSNAQIAAALVLSVRTVERHIMNLYPKIGAHNRAEAAGYAIHHGLV